MLALNQSRIDARFLGSLEPEAVLFDYDGPRSFTARDLNGDLLYLHQCDQSETTWRYLVVPFNELLLDKLESGQIDICTALDQPRRWIADIGQDGVEAVYRIHSAEVVESYLPVIGTTLYPKHSPILTVRSVGTGVGLGCSSAKLISGVLIRIRDFLEKLGGVGEGDGLSDLPIAITPGSISVSVLPQRNVQQDFFDTDESWKRISLVFDAALSAAVAETRTIVTDGIPIALRHEFRLTLEAIRVLAPPEDGPIDYTEITGRLVSSRVVRRLGRHSGKRLTAALPPRAAIAEESQDITGIINELDKQKKTCLLRDPDGRQILKLHFSSDNLGSVNRVFDSGRVTKVRVVKRGATIGDLIEIL